MPAYPGIYPFITNRLQDSDDGAVESGSYDSEIAAVLLKILQPYNLTYGDPSIVGNDLANLNLAAGLLTAARLITPLSTQGLNFDIASERTEFESRALATGERGEKDRWIIEASECIARITFVALARPAFSILELQRPKRRVPELEWGDDHC